jgi:hypothetical protein
MLTGCTGMAVATTQIDVESSTNQIFQFSVGTSSNQTHTLLAPATLYTTSMTTGASKFD